MARIAMDTRAQNSWKELIEKESATRLACKLNQETFKDEDEWFHRAKYSENRPTTVGQMPTLNFPPRPKRNRPVDSLLEQASKIKELKSLSDMKKADAKTESLLYEGFTKEGKGRYQYLRARTAANPEEKYEFPILSSWEYGWRLRDVNQTFKTPSHGRSKIVEESFYRRNGVFELKRN